MLEDVERHNIQRLLSYDSTDSSKHTAKSRQFSTDNLYRWRHILRYDQRVSAHMERKQLLGVLHTTRPAQHSALPSLNGTHHFYAWRLLLRHYGQVHQNVGWHRLHLMPVQFQRHVHASGKWAA